MFANKICVRDFFPLGLLGAVLGGLWADSARACITGEEYRVKEWKKSTSNRGGYDLIFSVVDRKTKAEREIYVPQDGGRVVALLALQSGRNDFTEKAVKATEAGKKPGVSLPTTSEEALSTYCKDSRVRALRISVTSVPVLKDAVREMDRALFENRSALQVAVADAPEIARTRVMKNLTDLTGRVRAANDAVSKENLDTISGETYCAVASALVSPLMTVPTKAELNSGDRSPQYGVQYNFAEISKGSKLKDLKPEQANEKFLVQPYPYQASAVAEQFAGTKKFAAYPILANEITGYTAPKPRGGCNTSVNAILPDGASGAGSRSGSGSISSDVK